MTLTCPFLRKKGFPLPCNSLCAIYDASYKMCSVKVIARILKRMDLLIDPSKLMKASKLLEEAEKKSQRGKLLAIGNKEGDFILCRQCGERIWKWNDMVKKFTQIVRYNNCVPKVEELARREIT